ncbi:MAG: hypothetical protein HYV63_29145 [Candidatus Schekmanbacteria bacterium]|nr:hypothetical protein [Candidatus Schekmanbacteria bacterium]
MTNQSSAVMPPWPRHFDLRGTDRLLVVFSDIEMGAGGQFDDFPHSDFLGEIILSYDEPPFDEIAVDIVFNGDTFDLLKTSYLGQHPHHINRDVALGKMAAVAAAHPRFFESLRRFLSFGGAPRNVHFVAGNHDAEILFPSVRKLIRTLCDATDQITFPGFELEIGKVHIEHGSQLDPLFRMEVEHPFVEHNGEELLNISWATVALLDVAMPLLPLFYFHDRLKPKKVVLDLIPEAREVIIGAFWRYWTREYWRAWFRSSDPMMKISWTMIKELVRRFGSQDPEVTVGEQFQRELQDSDKFDLYLLGHQHQARWWSHGSRKILQTGCFRNEYMVLNGGHTLRPIPKTYAEAYLRGDEVYRSHLVELDGPQLPTGSIPESIFEIQPRLREILAVSEERAAGAATPPEIEPETESGGNKLERKEAGATAGK